MRDLEQCKAEVFRRSEEIIRKRKTVRRCVIAACVPLCILLGVWASLILPAMMPASADNAMAEAPAMLEDAEKYNGNTLNTSPTTQSVIVVVEGVSYSVSGQESSAAAEFLPTLEYNPAKVCKCLPQFQVVTETGTYGIHLGEGYARCRQGQAALTQEQIDILQILLHTAVPDWTAPQKIS